MSSPNGKPSTNQARSIAALLLRPSVGQPSRAAILVRLAVGGVFVSSGLVKLLFENQGPGRFAKLGLPAATEFLDPIVPQYCWAFSRAWPRCR